jgi:hypothetical protein
MGLAVMGQRRVNEDDAHLPQLQREKATESSTSGIIS